MRALIASLCFAVAATAVSQEFSNSDRFGKTVDETLAMGHEAWVAWYTDESRGGGSTAGMAGAERIFGDCLAVKNRSALAKLSEKERTTYAKLEKALEQISDHCQRIGGAFTGGGTMWIPIGAAMDVSVQQTLADLLWTGNFKEQSGQNAVWAQWRAVKDALEAQAKDIDDMAPTGGLKSKQAGALLETVGGTFEAATNLMTGQTVERRRRFFGCCLHLLKSALAGASSQ